MATTPTRAGLSPQGESRFFSEFVATNVRDYRAVAGFTQDELAVRMVRLGHVWVRPTVSEVERNRRNVTVDELAGLAAALGVTVAALIDPRGPGRAGQSNEKGLDVGGRMMLPPALALSFITEASLDENRSNMIAAHIGLNVDPEKRLKDLEAEVARLRKLLADAEKGSNSAD